MTQQQEPDSINQYDVFWISFDNSVGSEIQKTRPCVVVSPNEMNENLKTVVVAPITKTKKNYPTRCSISVKNVSGYAILDQLTTVSKKRLSTKAGTLSPDEIALIKNIIKQAFVD